MLVINTTEFQNVIANLCVTPSIDIPKTRYLSLKCVQNDEHFTNEAQWQ